MLCDKCGKELAVDSLFCSKCGNKAQLDANSEEYWGCEGCEQEFGTESKALEHEKNCSHIVAENLIRSKIYTVLLVVIVLVAGLFIYDSIRDEEVFRIEIYCHHGSKSHQPDGCGFTGTIITDVSKDEDEVIVGNWRFVSVVDSNSVDVDVTCTTDCPQNSDNEDDPNDRVYVEIEIYYNGELVVDIEKVCTGSSQNGCSASASAIKTN